MKERRKITEIIIKDSAEISSIVPNEDGTVSLIDVHGKRVDHEQHDSVGYLRDSGKPKILRSIVRDCNDLVGENPWKKYDKIGFIDTNSIKSDGLKLYVCSPSLLLWQDEYMRLANVHHIDLLVGYCPTGVNPERIGLRDFIERLQSADFINDQDQVLVVVDSDKASISSINERKESVFDDYRLPTNFTVSYATSDAGAESWINKEMKRRDRVASLAIAKIQTDPRFLAIVRENGNLYIKNVFE